MVSVTNKRYGSDGHDEKTWSSASRVEVRGWTVALCAPPPQPPRELPTWACSTFATRWTVFDHLVWWFIENIQNMIFGVVKIGILLCKEIHFGVLHILNRVCFNQISNMTKKWRSCLPLSHKSHVSVLVWKLKVVTDTSYSDYFSTFTPSTSCLKFIIATEYLNCPWGEETAFHFPERLRTVLQTMLMMMQ